MRRRNASRAPVAAGVIADAPASPVRPAQVGGRAPAPLGPGAAAKPRTTARAIDVRADVVEAAASSSALPAAWAALAGLKASEWPSDLIEVGRVADAYGLKGQVKVAPFSVDAQALLGSRDWWFDSARFGRLLGRTRGRRRQGEALVAHIDGIDDRSPAEALRGARVYVRRSDFPAPDDADNEFYWVDLIGCAVRNRQHMLLGTVVGLLDNGAQSVLRVATAASAAGETHEGGTRPAERLIPFVAAYVDRVDLSTCTIWVDWQPDY